MGRGSRMKLNDASKESQEIRVYNDFSCSETIVYKLQNLGFISQQYFNIVLTTTFSLFSPFPVCIGTNGRMSVPNNREHHYRNLRDRYTNCTYVDGNLELTWLQDEDMDLSFLRHIREVTGYVLISHVDVRRIELPSLQIIRGRTLFKLNVQPESFALIVTLSKMHNLEMPALRGRGIPKQKCTVISSLSDSRGQVYYSRISPPPLQGPT